MDSVGEGEGGKIWENGNETCKISCRKRVASPGSMHNTGCLGLVHWDDPEGWYGEGGGFRMGNTCIPVADSFWYLAKLIQYCKVKKKKKRRLLLGRKVMTNLDSIFKSRDITLPTKIRLVKPMVFPVVMYGCESWAVKKADCQRIDAFELWCWRRLLRVPWTARRSNLSILKEISPGISLEGMMLKLKL